MSGSINKVMLIGHLGADPELKNIPDGSSIVTLRLATSETFYDKNNPTQKKEATEWHRVTFFGRSAEVIHEYARKGSQIYIEGALQTRKWQDKEGKDRWTTDIRGLRFQFLGGRGDSGGGGGGGAAASSGGGNRPGEDNFSDMDDVPF